MMTTNNSRSHLRDSSEKIRFYSMEKPVSCESDGDCPDGQFCCSGFCSSEPCPKQCNEIGFPAFQGSCKCFKKMGIYDLDCCSLGSFNPDGYYIVERQGDQCVVVESNNWYAVNGYGVGAVIACPDPYPVVNTRPNAPINSETKKSLSYEFPGDPCCNDTDGGAQYAELTEEIESLPCSSSSETGPDCITFQWANNAPAGGSCESPVLGGRVTVTIPEYYSIPPEGLLISISFAGDDQIKFNGSRYGDTGCVNPTIDTTDRVFSRTFDVDFLDTAGSNVGGGGCICILEGRTGLGSNSVALPCGGGYTSSEINGWKVYSPCTDQQSFPNFVNAGSACASLNEGPKCSGTPGNCDQEIDPRKSLRNTGCGKGTEPSFSDGGCSQAQAFSDDPNYPYEGECDQDCHERFSCVEGNLCVTMGFYKTSEFPLGSYDAPECETACQSDA